MSFCSTHIVECLRNDNIEPVTYSSSIYSSEYLPQYGLIYDTSNHYSSASGDNQWWVVDFQSNVLIESYSIMAGSGSGWTYNWDLEASFDGLEWGLVHGMRNTICVDQIFTLNASVLCRSLRIIGRGLTVNGGHTYVQFYYVKFHGSLYPITPNPNCPYSSIDNKCVVHLFILSSFICHLLSFSCV